MKRKYDIFGIGSALMDFLIEIDNKELVALKLKKGNFHLIDKKSSLKLLKNMAKHKIISSPGGSSANTLYGAAILGGKVIFCGKVGLDKQGKAYSEATLKSCIKSNLVRSEQATGHAITFITPDSERTFAVHLGATLELEKKDIILDYIKSSKILHIEGYQLEDKRLRGVALHAMDFAKKNNTRISIDLGDPGVVKRNKKEIIKIIKKYANIVFANEEEAKTLTSQKVQKALEEISNMADIAVVKVGKKGSYIKQGQTIYKIRGYKVDAIDTTGAGDMFAAGFLYGLCRNYDLKKSGYIGSYFAAKVVQQIGARLKKVNKREIKKIFKNGNL